MQLTRVIDRIRAGHRRVELTVVQYGATRARLAEVAGAPAGWDVLHLSGHGGAGTFTLERADGSPDQVNAAELVRLLAPLSGRTRLAVLSACESAATTTERTLRWAGLTEQADAIRPDADLSPLDGMARSVSAGLGCAVVAMRYPVTDDFATAFAADLYRRLLGGSGGPETGSQPLAIAVAGASVAAAGSAPTASRPALSVATPVLLASAAQAGLTIGVPPEPPGPPGSDASLLRMRHFPPQAERFAGRTSEMASASAALAPGSGRTGLLLYGMPGAGKTACAVELAYRHQDSFQAVAFWRAPAADDVYGTALASLAAALDLQLGELGCALSGHLGSARELAAGAAHLGALLSQHDVLLVLDHAETLVTADGTWRDQRVATLISALISQAGRSRTVLTSRVPPAGLAGQLRILPVCPLDLAESAALARELPGLRELLHLDVGLIPDPVTQAEVTADRALLRQVLSAVQGHPGLMELAAVAGQITGSGADELLGTLSAWTTAILDALPRPAALMARFLARIEDADRIAGIIDASWADLWRRLSLAGDPPGPRPLLDALTSNALIRTGQEDDPDLLTYQLHPAVAQAIRARTSQDILDAADHELGAFWHQFFHQGLTRPGGESGRMLRRSGLAAMPYLMRQHSWTLASSLASQTIARDRSPAAIKAALPFLRAIAEATGAARDLSVLGGALRSVDPGQAEELLRTALDRRVTDQDFRGASGTAGSLINLLMDAGRLDEALQLSERMARYTRQAGLGPWSQLADQAWRLRILLLMGENRQVLDQVAALREQMRALPVTRTGDEAAEPWNVAESILRCGADAAVALLRWQQALTFSAAVLAGKQARGASAHELARTRLNDSTPLRRLGRLHEAARLLTDCQQVFEDSNDLASLAAVLSDRASLEARRGNLPVAVAFEQTALRYGYLLPGIDGLAASHHNLANYLDRASSEGAGSDPAAQRAHRLAAALLYRLAGMTHDLDRTQAMLATELQHGGGTGGETGPGIGSGTGLIDLAGVIEVTERTEGVRLGELIATLQPDPRAAGAVLRQLLADAASLDVTRLAPTADDYTRRWEEVIALTVAAARGDAGAADRLAPKLDSYSGSKDWGIVAGVLRRIAATGASEAGGTGGDGTSLVDDLDPIDTAIVVETLVRLDQAAHSPSSRAGFS